MTPPASRRPPGQPRSLKFRREREAEWTELEQLVNRALNAGLARLNTEELQRLPALYRATLSALMVARETALDRELVRYLDALAARAYLVVYGNRRPRRRIFATFFLATFPRVVRTLAPEVALSALLFGLGAVVAFALVSHESTWFYGFVPEGLAAGRNPGSSTEALRSALYDSPNGELSTFSSFLFTHNFGIGMMSFALGIAVGVPTALLVFQNGLILGAFTAVYADRGLLVPVLGWLLPHGIPEILGLVLCGAAGLHVGRALVFPGRLDARDALRRNGGRGALVVAGTIVLFAVAGVVEGVFRQVVTNDGIRFALALFNATWVCLWFAAPGGRPASRGATSALAPRGKGP